MTAARSRPLAPRRPQGLAGLVIGVPPARRRCQGAVGRRAGLPPDGTGRRLRAQRLRAHRHRRHRHRAGQAHRVRPGALHRPRDPRGRGAGRRLVARCAPSTRRPTPTSTRISRSACRAPAARRPSPTPTSRCARPAPTARAMLVAGRGAGLGRAGQRDHGRARRAAARQVRRGRAASASSPRPRRKLPVPRERAAEGPGAIPADRPRRRGARSSTAPPRRNGTAQFTIDIREPDMLTVVVARPPRFGGKVASFDAARGPRHPGRRRRQADPVAASPSTPTARGRRSRAARS